MKSQIPKNYARRNIEAKMQKWKTMHLQNFIERFMQMDTIIMANSSKITSMFPNENRIFGPSVIAKGFDCYCDADTTRHKYLYKNWVTLYT